MAYSTAPPMMVPSAADHADTVTHSPPTVRMNQRYFPGNSLSRVSWLVPGLWPVGAPPRLAPTPSMQRVIHGLAARGLASMLRVLSQPEQPRGRPTRPRRFQNAVAVTASLLWGAEGFDSGYDRPGCGRKQGRPPGGDVWMPIRRDAMSLSATITPMTLESTSLPRFCDVRIMTSVTARFVRSQRINDDWSGARLRMQRFAACSG